MTALGLIVAIFIYPLMHEGGHVLATLIGGGEVKEFMVFPLPNILSDVSGVSNAGLIFIGLSGAMLPFFLSVVYCPKYFFLWYCSFIFKGIVLLSILISSVVIIMNQFGFTTLSNDDMIKVLNYWKNGTFILLTILFLSGLLMVVSIARDHPIKRILKEFA